MEFVCYSGFKKGVWMQRFAVICLMALLTLSPSAYGQTVAPPPPPDLGPPSSGQDSKGIDAGDVWLAVLLALPITLSAFAIYESTKKKKPVSP